MPKKRAPSMAAMAALAFLTGSGSTVAPDVAARFKRIEALNKAYTKAISENAPAKRTLETAKALIDGMKKLDGFDLHHSSGTVRLFPQDETGNFVIVPYHIEPNVKENVPEICRCIRLIMNNYEDTTSLRFVEVPLREAQYVMIAQKKDAFGGAETRNVNGKAVTEFFNSEASPAFVVAHELGHVLGFRHVNERPASVLGVRRARRNGAPYEFAWSGFYRKFDLNIYPVPADELAIMTVYGCHGVKSDCGKKNEGANIRPRFVKSGKGWRQAEPQNLP